MVFYNTHSPRQVCDRIGRVFRTIRQMDLAREKEIKTFKIRFKNTYVKSKLFVTIQITHVFAQKSKQNRRYFFLYTTCNTVHHVGNLTLSGMEKTTNK